MLLLRVLIGVTLALWLGLAVRAQADPQTCAAIDDSLRRLHCFDQMFPRVSEKGDAQPEAVSTKSGDELASPKWFVDTDKSPLDDSPLVMAALSPIEATSSGYGKPQALLIMACRENTTSVIFSTGEFMTEDRVPVTIRFGSDAARTEKWSISTTRKSAGLWRGSQAIPFIREMRGHARLFLRAEDRQRVNAIFDLGNVKEAAAQVAEACNWE